VRLPRHHTGRPRAKLGMSCRLARRGCQAGSDLVWPRQGVGHHVGHAGDVQNVTRALGDDVLGNKKFLRGWKIYRKFGKIYV